MFANIAGLAERGEAPSELAFSSLEQRALRRVLLWQYWSSVSLGFSRQRRRLQEGTFVSVKP